MFLIHLRLKACSLKSSKSLPGNSSIIDFHVIVLSFLFLLINFLNSLASLVESLGFLNILTNRFPKDSADQSHLIFDAISHQNEYIERPCSVLLTISAILSPVSSQNFSTSANNLFIVDLFPSYLPWLMIFTTNWFFFFVRILLIRIWKGFLLIDNFIFF